MQKDARAVRAWLWIAVSATYGLFVLGGIVRLTGSGLSMTVWEPLVGVLPPVGAAAWERVFAAYRATPEYLHLNTEISLAGFQRLFWLEWSHRLWARLLGLLIGVPALVFYLRRALPRSLVRGVFGLVALVVVQGALGWYMVASGLESVPHVSHYRLALHFGLGLAIFGTLIDLRLRLTTPEGPRPTRAGTAVAVTVGVTAWSGAFMAGLKAGRMFDTFPSMHGALVPAGLADIPWWTWLDNPYTVHFLHRALAFGALLAVLLYGLHGGGSVARRALVLLATAQVGLGAATVLLGVPVWLASLHQANALLVFAAALWARRTPTVARLS